MSADWEDWEQGRLGFAGLLKLLWQKRVLVALTVALTTALFVTAAFLLPPIYRSSVLLMPVSGERGGAGSLGSVLDEFGGLAALAGITLGSRDAESEEALAVFRSRQFTDRFISDNDLAKRLFANKWDPDKNRWKVPADEVPTAAQAYEYFDEKVRKLSRDNKTGMVTLRIEWRNRHEAAAWANELVRRVNMEMRQRAIEQANASIEFLRAEIRNTSDIGTQEAIYRLIEAQVKQRMLANVTREYAFRVVDKAAVPDADQIVRPRKWLLLALGVFVGAALGVTLAVVSAAVSALRASSQRSDA